ncbi:MAG: hypothetical protein ACREJB_07260, partial [Planctomycetaceae bacterium]
LEVRFLDRNGSGNFEAIQLIDAGNEWRRLRRLGLLIDGTRIFIEKEPYVVDLPTPYDHDGNPMTANVSPTNELWLRTPYRNASAPGPTTMNGDPAAPAPIKDYRLVLQPTVMPGQEPVLLSQGIVIDMNHSELASGWGVSVNPQASSNPQGYRNRPPYSNRLDMMFSPRGTVTGREEAAGVVHFYLADVADVERSITPGVASEDLDGDEVLDMNEDLNGNGVLDVREGDEALVTIFTRTGHISTPPLDVTDVRNNTSGANTPDGRPDDLFRFAETGEEAK